MTIEHIIERSAPVELPSARDRRLNRLGKIAYQVLPPLAMLGVLLTAWWWFTRHGQLPSLLFPKPSEVGASLQRGLIEGLWWPHIGTTMSSMVLGLAFGVVVGLILGALFAYVDIVRVILYPFVMALQSFPKIAIAPLLIVALGYGQTPKIVVAALLAYFPVMTASVAGFTQVDREELNFMRSMKASKYEEMRYLRLPNAMSYIFPALDVALVSALLGAVGAELVGANAGLGYILVERTAFGDTPSIFGVLVVLGVIGALLRAVMVTIRVMLPRSIVPR
ncbi:ABC transporter permease [Aeromicrobium sp. YIM 150415]|uniref:ABC transporter permease n=1 Tax=Aeromicrobium sp. YIM 150415 TaxID=2803912 RepID=UPI001962ACB5|nr:ABC transporter permease [Aeromicrobium sp. YIM 150415]MBM9462421.1 ABC transporter permease [Aeromicrobium sp. YIM 150415]